MLGGCAGNKNVTVFWTVCVWTLILDSSCCQLKELSSWFEGPSLSNPNAAAMQ